MKRVILSSFGIHLLQIISVLFHHIVQTTSNIVQFSMNILIWTTKHSYSALVLRMGLHESLPFQISTNFGKSEKFPIPSYTPSRHKFHLPTPMLDVSWIPFGATFFQRLQEPSFLGHGHICSHNSQTNFLHWTTSGSSFKWGQIHLNE